MGGPGRGRHEGGAAVKAGRLDHLAAWGLAAAFIWAALPKLADPPGFAQTLAGYALLPEAALAPAALLLPWVETCAALALLWPRTRRSAALLAMGLLLVFAVALGTNLAKGRVLDCGCFGRGPTLSREEGLRRMRWALGRDAALLLVALSLVIRRREP